MTKHDSSLPRRNSVPALKVIYFFLLLLLHNKACMLGPPCGKLCVYVVTFSWKENSQDIKICFFFFFFLPSGLWAPKDPS